MADDRDVAIDLLIVTALAEELRSAREAIEAAVGSEPQRKQIAEHQLLTFQIPVTIGLRDLRLSAVLASVDHMAGASMASKTSTLLRSLRPQAACLTGIAGGIEEKIELGSAISASQVFSYDNMAIEDGEISVRADGFHVAARLWKGINDITIEKTAYRHWKDDCRRVLGSVVEALNQDGEEIKAVDCDPEIFSEPLASTPFLVRDEGFRQALKGQETGEIRFAQVPSTKVAWFEMEAYGFMTACRDAEVPGSVVKGKSDAGDKEKKKQEKETGGFFRVAATVHSLMAILEGMKLSAIAPCQTNVHSFSATRDRELKAAMLAECASDRRKGRNFQGFGEFLKFAGPALEVTVSVQGVDESGAAVVPEAWRVEDVQSHQRPDATIKGDRLVFYIQRARRDSTVSLGLRFDRPVTHVRVSSKGPFVANETEQELAVS